ncbi:TolC family protein [Porphyromonadaceae bacterium]
MTRILIHRWGVVAFFIALCISAIGQELDTLQLTLHDAIAISRKNSPEAIAARHSFLASYWEHKSVQAAYLPSLTLTSTPNLNRSISSIIQPDGSEKFVERNQLTTGLTLTVNQNIPFTGGSIFMTTSLQRIDLFSNNTSSYQSSPITIGYSQKLLGYNSMKWQRRNEPIRYQATKKQYVQTLEFVGANTINHFFNLATAQNNLEIAEFNYANADTLYRFAEGRYNLGTITENELLQLEINKLTEETNMMNARVSVDNYTQTLRSYLGIASKTVIVVNVTPDVPRFNVEGDLALNYAHENNPEIDWMKYREIDSHRQVANAKGNVGLKADLYAQVGLTQTSADLSGAYQGLLDQEYISIGIRVPILDWGVGRGKVKVSESNRDRILTQLTQDRNTFDLNVDRVVKQFNLQSDRVTIAMKTDETTKRRHEVARKLYLLGKSTVLDLNASIAERDKARRNFVSALHSYWSLYAALRYLTMFDFEKKTAITEDYEYLLK